MTTLCDLNGKTFQRVKTTQAGNIFSDGKITCLLKPTNREFQGSSKKPVYYLSALVAGKSEYLSGMFATNDPEIFSADYKDGLGIKHIVHVQFANAGQSMTIKAV